LIRRPCWDCSARRRKYEALPRSEGCPASNRRAPLGVGQQQNQKTSDFYRVQESTVERMREVPGTTTAERQQVMQQTSGPQNQRVSAPSSGRLVSLALQLLGAVLVVAAVIVGLFASHAGASSLSNGTVTLRVGSGNSVATNPLVSHQLVTVSVGPNSTLSRSSLESAGFPSGAVPIKILECADPGGLAANLPQSLKQCEPETIDPNGTAQQDGSMVESGYTIYALPDPTDLGTSNGTVCDIEHQCVLGIFSNQEDFSKPHLFSAPFQTVSTGTGGGATPTSTPSASGNGSASTGGASAAVSVPPATLADTGGPTLWPWLLGAGAVLLVGGTALRGLRRPAPGGRR
jgi:hypothetical protein